MEIRTLRANEIECRVGSINMASKRQGFTLLLYKDARCDMQILDETFGAFKWKREHSRDNANCTVSIWCDELKQWVSKEDVGTESYTEKEKGLASDSFKRACVNWGIGRELYTAPMIWLPAEYGNIKEKDINGSKKYEVRNRFKVTDITYNKNREIDGIEIANAYTGEVVFKKEAVKIITPEQAENLRGTLKDVGKDITACEEYYQKPIDEFTEQEYAELIKKLIKERKGE